MSDTDLLQLPRSLIIHCRGGWGWFRMGRVGGSGWLRGRTWNKWEQEKYIYPYTHAYSCSTVCIWNMEHPGILGSNQSEISPLLCTLPNRMSRTLWLQYYTATACTHTKQYIYRQSVQHRVHVVCDSQLYTHMHRFWFRKYHIFLT